jgi:hypothetical protein
LNPQGHDKEAKYLYALALIGGLALGVAMAMAVWL